LQKVASKREVNAQHGARGGKAKALKNNNAALANAIVSLKQPEPEPEESKREANASPKTKRGSRLSPDWFLPMEWGEWAVSQGLDPGTIRSEADRFRDYWCAKPGQHGVKLDWQATWRNWIRSAKDRGNANRNARQIPQGGKRADPALEQILRLTGLSQASVNGGGGTGSLGEEDGPFRLGT
jgi:hypothetical protein